MCGIVGVASETQIAEKLIDGLLKQEYRGYDSSGLAVFGKDSNRVQVVKRAGRVMELKNATDSLKLYLFTLTIAYQISHL